MCRRWRRCCCFVVVAVAVAAAAVAVAAAAAGARRCRLAGDDVAEGAPQKIEL